MNLTLTSEDVNEPTKIKAINPHIIVGGSAEQPYYSIEYYDVEKEQFYIGYSSCYLSTVFKWLNKCFDVVAGDADVIIRNLKADKEALIAGQETLQKALAEKDKEIEKLNDALINKCIYLSDDETTEYCVNGPCPEFKTESQIKSEAIKEVLLQLEAEAESSDKYIQEYDDSETQKAYNKGLWTAYNLVKEMVGDTE